MNCLVKFYKLRRSRMRMHNILNDFNKKALLNSLKEHGVLNIFEDNRLSKSGTSRLVVYFKYKGFINSSSMSTSLKSDNKSKTKSFDVSSFAELSILNIERIIRHIDMRLHFFEDDMLDAYLDDVYKYVSNSIQSVLNISNFFNFFGKNIYTTGRGFDNRIKNMLVNGDNPLHIYTKLLKELGVDLQVYESNLEKLNTHGIFK